MNLVEWLEMTEQAGMASAEKAGTAQASTMAAVEVAKKRGRPKKPGGAMSDAERARRYRARKKSQS